jgi:PBP1b-binding outer membrane lipoprotein LpoB
MKKFAIFLMALSVSMFTLGCQPPAAKKPEEKKPAPEKTEPSAPAETPAAPK